VTHARSARPRTAAALLLACACLGAPLHAQPVEKKPDGAAPARTAQPERPMRERFRQRLAQIVEDLRADQDALQKVIERMDKGESFDELRPLIPDRLANRLRFDNDSDGPGGPGGRGEGRRGPGGGDRPEWDRGERGAGGGGGGGGGMGRGPDGNRSNEPFSDEDWQAVNAIITHAQPEMLPKFKELRERDPAQAQRLTLAAYPRLRPLLDLYRHDRAAFDLRLEEMAIVRESLPLAKEVLDLRTQGKAEDSAEIKAAKARMRDLARRQVVNRIAIQRSDIESLRKRLDRREKELAESAANPDAGVDRSIDMLIKQAERGDGPGSSRRGGPPGPPPDSPGDPRSDDRPPPPHKGDGPGT
jgi:hypothetical protein